MMSKRKPGDADEGCQQRQRDTDAEVFQEADLRARSPGALEDDQVGDRTVALAWFGSSLPFDSWIKSTADAARPCTRASGPTSKKSQSITSAGSNTMEFRRFRTGSPHNPSNISPTFGGFCPSRGLGNGHSDGGMPPPVGGMPSRKKAMRATAYFAAVGEARANRAGDACVWSRPPASDFVTPVDTLARLQQFWSEMA